MRELLDGLDPRASGALRLVVMLVVGFALAEVALDLSTAGALGFSLVFTAVVVVSARVSTGRWLWQDPRDPDQP